MTQYFFQPHITLYLASILMIQYFLWNIVVKKQFTCWKGQRFAVFHLTCNRVIYSPNPTGTTLPPSRVILNLRPQYIYTTSTLVWFYTSTSHRSTHYSLDTIIRTNFLREEQRCYNMLYSYYLLKNCMWKTILPSIRFSWFTCKKGYISSLQKIF